MSETQALARQGDGPPPKLTDEAISGIVENIKQWEKFKQAALGPKDFTYMGDNQYIEKSGWVKLAMAMNVSFEILGEGQRVDGHDNEGDYYTWKFLGRVTTPKGRYVQMDGACSSRDEFFSMKRDGDGNSVRRLPAEIDEKDIIATAQTNCFNRCMAFLFGFGELSGDEMRGKQFAKKPITFPFGDLKGQEPSSLDLATLKKSLPFWEKQAADTNNKFAASNLKLLNAIREAIAEKSSKVDSPAAPSPSTSQGGLVQGQDGKPEPPAGEPSPKEALLIRIHELVESGAVTKAKITKYAHDQFQARDLNDLPVLSLQAIIAWVGTLAA